MTSYYEKIELWRGQFERAYREEDPNANLRPVLDNDGKFMHYYVSCTDYMWAGWVMAMEFAQEQAKIGQKTASE